MPLQPAALPAACAAGCPLSTPAFVCGADGITYMTACLATCSGKTPIAYPGPCLPGGATGVSSDGPTSTTGPARPSPASLARRHPIASLLGGAKASSSAGVSAQAAGPTVVVSPADMVKYAGDGFVLVGVVPQADPAAAVASAAAAQVGPVKPSANPDAA